MIQVGRNDPCPCGSGKKYKKCCAEKTAVKANAAGSADHIRQSIEAARQYISAGQPAYAEMLCSEVLSASPANAELNFFLGMALAMQGKTEAAIAAYETAVRSTPDHFGALCNLGGLLSFNPRRLAEAERILRRATALNRDSHDAYTNLGVVQYNQGKLNEAIVSYRRALQAKPDFVAAHYNLGNALQDQSELDEAIACYQRAIALAPNHAEAHNNLGNALQGQRKLEESVQWYQRAIALDPHHREAHTNLGNALRDQRKLEESFQWYRRAIALDPNHRDAHLNLAVALQNQGDLDAALTSYRSVLQIKPDCTDTHFNIAVALQQQGDLDAALASYRRALQIKPDCTDTHLGLALLLLREGDLEQGWKEYEYRWAKTRERVLKRAFPQPWWQGEALAGKTILLWSEQGIGEEILFAGMYEDVIAQAGRCVIECAAKLVPLFARSFPAAQVVPKTDPPHPATLDGIDYQCGAGSLARWLRPGIDSFPARAAFLVPAPERVAYWKARLAELGPGPKIGFSWRSSLMSGTRPLHCSSLDQWGPIFAVPGVHFVNLQYDECAAELNDARQRFNVPLHAFAEVDLLNDLDEAAALTQALDLVISAPTSVSVLSAALGVPTWMMNYGVPWETLGTEHLPWLPTLRCFNRPWNATWDETIRRIAGLARQRQTHAA